MKLNKLTNISFKYDHPLVFIVIVVEFKGVLKETIPWLEYLADEYHCTVVKKEWRSKYNNYVVYDYEPFCSEGFEINMTLSSSSPQFLNFVKYLYDKKMSVINYLNNCIDI